MTFDDYRSEAEVGFYIPLYGFDVDATEELNLEGAIWCIFQHEAGSLTLHTCCTFSSQRWHVCNRKRRVHRNNPDWWNPKIFCDIGSLHVPMFLSYFGIFVFVSPAEFLRSLFQLVIGHISALQEYFGRQASQAHITMWHSFLFLRSRRESDTQNTYRFAYFPSQ